MKIGKIASSAEYLMHDKLKNLSSFGIWIAFQIKKIC